MAKILSVTMGRPEHYPFTRLDPTESTLFACSCLCGAEWHNDLETWGSFCQWADAHQAPTARRTFRKEQCQGSGDLVHESLTDGSLGSYVAWCHKCNRYRPTVPQHGYDGYRQFTPHPVYVRVPT